MKNFRTPPPDPKNWEQVIEKLEELHDRGLTISMMNPRRSGGGSEIFDPNHRPLK